jgi:hypothetical protein
MKQSADRARQLPENVRIRYRNALVRKFLDAYKARRRDKGDSERDENSFARELTNVAARVLRRAPKVRIHTVNTQFSWIVNEAAGDCEVREFLEAILNARLADTSPPALFDEIDNMLLWTWDGFEHVKSAVGPRLACAMATWPPLKKWSLPAAHQCIESLTKKYMPFDTFRKRVARIDLSTEPPVRVSHANYDREQNHLGFGDSKISDRKTL